MCVEYSLSLSSILVMEDMRRKRERSWTLTVWGFFSWAHRNGQESLTDDNSNCQSHPSLWPQTPRYTRRIRRETVDCGCGPSLKPKKDDHFQPLSRLPGVLTREKVVLCSRWKRKKICTTLTSPLLCYRVLNNMCAGDDLELIEDQSLVSSRAHQQ